MQWLLRQHAAGELERTPVVAPDPPPSWAPPLARAIYDEWLLWWELRMTVLEDRSLPYAAAEPERAGFTADKRHASRAIRWLVRHGYAHVDHDARCANGEPMRTRCYLPGRPGDCPDGRVLPARNLPT